MKVSIILAVYNSSLYLKETLNSIENQTYENIELIAVDNESTDGSYEILQNHKSKFEYAIDIAPNIYKHSYEEPFMKALELTSGEWFTIIGSDDTLSSEYINNCVKIINKFENKYKCFQSYILQIQDNKCGKTTGHHYKDIKEFKELFLKKCPVNTPTLFFHKSLKDFMKMESELYLGAGDYNLCGHLTDNNVFIYPIPFYLGYNYRIHPNQLTWIMLSGENNMDAKIQEKWGKKWGMKT